MKSDNDLLEIAMSRPLDEKIEQSAGQAREFKRWPKYEEAWKRAFQRLYSASKDEPNNKGNPRFFAKYRNWQEFYVWWSSGKGQGDTEQCQSMFMFAGDDDINQ